MDIQFLSKSRILGYGTTEMRCVQPSEYLSRKGWRTGVGCIYRSLPKARRAIVFHRVTLDSHSETYLRYAKAQGLVTIYDIDDLLFDDCSTEHLSSLGGRENGDCGDEPSKSYRDAMKKCDVVLASTNYLRQRAEVFHSDVRMIKNGLSADFVHGAESFYRAKSTPQKNHITVAYLSGSKHHDRDFELIEEALIKILENYPTTRLLLIGKLNYSDRFKHFSERFQYRSFVPYREFWQVFQDIDINIVPLRVSDSFAQARSELKYMEAGIFGIPTIASPTETYLEAISDGKNGLIADDSDWYEALKSLITDNEKRRSLGEAARADVLANYTPEKRSIQWNQLMTEILEKYVKNGNKRSLESGVAYIQLVYLWLIRMLKIGHAQLMRKRN